MALDNRRLDELLGPVLTHQFNVSRQQLRKGIVYKGSAHRLRNAVGHLLKADRPVKLGVIGGSVTFVANDVDAVGWWAKFVRYLTQAFPKAQIVAKNGAVPAAPAAYAAMCLELMVDMDVDVVFVEYALNDGFSNDIIDNHLGRVYERLVRKIMSKPNRPAVVIMQIPAHKQAFPPPQATPFHQSPEDAYGALAQYYDISWLSFRDVFWRLGRLKAEGYDVPDFFEKDLLHPAGLGQKAMSDLCVMLFQDTVLDLLMFPWDEQDQSLLAEPLPEPMYKDNWESSNKLCLHGQEFQSVVAAAEGFEFVNEGTDKKQKWGYVGAKVGSSLQLRFNSSQAGAKADLHVNLYIAYLKSYSQMGSAVVRCISGCSCKERQLDAFSPTNVSQTYLLKLPVSQSGACTIKVSITDATKTGGHKIKISGMMIGTAGKHGVDYDYPEGRWGKDLYHSAAEEHKQSLTSAASADGGG